MISWWQHLWDLWPPKGHQVTPLPTSSGKRVMKSSPWEPNGHRKWIRQLQKPPVSSKNRPDPTTSSKVISFFCFHNKVKLLFDGHRSWMWDARRRSFQPRWRRVSSGSWLGRRRPRLLDLVWAMDPLAFETPWTLLCNTTLRLPNKADLLFLVLTR